jgi:hypothetical protein
VSDLVIHFHNHRVPVSRYRDYAIRDGGTKLYVALDNPREVLTVKGAENVQAALLELQTVLSERDEQAMGGGWQE